METMYTPQNNGPHTSLVSAINSADNSITVQDGNILPPAPNVLTIGLGEDAELVLMQSKTGNILTVVRGYNGTTAKEWTASEWIYRAITAQDIRALQSNMQQALERVKTSESLLYNADFAAPYAVWNEGTSFANITTNTYTAEGWRAGLVGAGGSCSVAKAQNGLVLAANGQGAQIVQFVEGVGTLYEGQPVTIVAMIDGVVYRGNGPATTTGFSVEHPKGTLFVGLRNDGSQLLYVAVRTIAGVTATISWVHLAPGDVDIVHVPDDAATTVAKCQRYFQKTYRDSDAPGTVTLEGMVNKVAATASFFSASNITFFVPMRTVPTVRCYNPYIPNTQGWTSGGEPSNNRVMRTSFYISNRETVVEAQNADLTVGHIYWGHWTADARIY